MKEISKAAPQLTQEQAVNNWPKCEYCGVRHPKGLINCPFMKDFDRKVPGK